MSSSKWQTVNGVRYQTGLCQSHTDGLKDSDGPEYTVMDRGARRNPVPLARPSSVRAKSSTGTWMGKGPDPGGVAFLRAEEWGGVVEGYIHKNGEQGWGYYRTSPPPTEEKETFVHDGKEWETVKEISAEEAIALRGGNGREHLQGNASGNTMDDWPTSDEEDWTTVCDADLKVAAFGEGIPGQVASKEDSQETVVVYKDEEKTQMPFGMVETAPFLELLWRQTGADCDGEEEEMEFPGGGTYKILLCDSRGNL